MHLPQYSCRILLNFVAAEIAFLDLSHYPDGKKLPPAVVSWVVCMVLECVQLYCDVVCLYSCIANTCTGAVLNLVHVLVLEYHVMCILNVVQLQLTAVYTAVRTGVRLLQVMTG